MKHLARLFLVTTVLGLLGLVPIHAASAGVPSIDVVLTPLTGETITGETVNRVTAAADCGPVAGSTCVQVLTATVLDGAAPVTGQEVGFEWTSGPSDPDPGADPVYVPDVSCTTVATGKCTVSFQSSTEGTAVDHVVAWIEDGTLPIGDEADKTEPAAPDDGGDTDVVEVGWYDGVLNVYVPPITAPENEERTTAPSTDVKFEALVLEKDPPTGETAEKLVANVDAEVQVGAPPTGNADKTATGPDAECYTSQSAGTCELKYAAGATTGVDMIRAWIDRNENPNSAATPKPGDEEPGATSGYEGDDAEPLSPDDSDTTDVVKASISATPILQASPATQTKKFGETATITAMDTLGGVGENAKPIAMTVFAGPNAGKTGTCNTGSGGSCNVTYVGGTTAGTDKVRLWVDTDGNGLPNEGDATEDVGTQGSTPDPDTTAVVSVSWVAPTPDPTPEPTPDTSKCDAAKAKLAKAKRALKKAKANGDAQDISRAKKRVKRAKGRKQAACA
jgi:hypothetical protein